jgi:hypothetical protein
VVDVPDSTTLPELHDLLQVALGWTDSHLHQWRTDTATYTHDDDDGWDEAALDETGVLLRQLPAPFCYEYDFGDGWEHDVEVLGPGGDRPGVVSGEGACPPEDCGGPPGYDELRAVLADASHPEHAPMLEWCGGLPVFDLAAVDSAVRDVVGAVPPSVRLLLDLVGDGLALTPGGRLPRSVVHAFLAAHPEWSLTGKAALEEDLRPLLSLHWLLRDAGVLRHAKGRVLRTKASYDDHDVVRRIRRAYGADEFAVMLAERVLGLLVARGPQTAQALAPQVFSLLGHGWRLNGVPLDAEGVLRALWRRDDEFRALDLIVTERNLWTAGPSARSILPGVPLLAAHLAR